MLFRSTDTDAFAAIHMEHAVVDDLLIGAVDGEVRVVEMRRVLPVVNQDERLAFGALHVDLQGHFVEGLVRAMAYCMGRRGSGLAGQDFQHLEQVGFSSPFGGGGHIPFVAQGFQRFSFRTIGGEGEGSGEEDRGSVAHNEILTLSGRQSKPDQTYRGLEN